MLTIVLQRCPSALLLTVMAYPVLKGCDAGRCGSRGVIDGRGQIPEGMCS